MKGGGVDVSWKGEEASFLSCSCLYVLTCTPVEWHGSFEMMGPTIIVVLYLELRARSF